jgi:hypothetical protein
MTTESTQGVISAKEWDAGVGTTTSTEKAAKVIRFLESLEENAAAKMTAIATGSGLKWPYSTVKALVKAGTVEEKKLGKAKYYRLK